jgi:acyl-CoA dehydrogenase
MNESLGRSRAAPVVFGVQAPDSGNAEILAHFGTPEHKARYLQPLLDNEIVSCFALTEPHGGSDPTQVETRAVQHGDHWVLTGEKWFATNARFARFAIVVALTDPDVADRHKRLSAFIMPMDLPGVHIVRNLQVVNEPGDGAHAHLRLDGVRVPADHLLGPRGGAFMVAQVRLGNGRIHHAMRTLAQCQLAFELMCERPLARSVVGGRLADKQLVQAMIADSWLDLEQFRLLLLRTAWKIDHSQDARAVRLDIAAVKTLMPRVLHDIAARALQIHGALGMTNDVPFIDQLITSFRMGLADGPTEVHKLTLAKEVLRTRSAHPSGKPSYNAASRRAAALERFAALLEAQGLEP